MVTPKKELAIQKAKEIWFNEQWQNGNHTNINPTESELKECGAFSQAVSELMRDQYKHKVERDYIDFPESFDVDIKEAMQTTSFISGSRGIGKSDVAMRIVDRLTNEGIICLIFDPSTDWIRRSSIRQYITVKPYSILPIPEYNTIFNISTLTPIQQQQCVERFCKKLFEHQLENDSNKYYLVFEESQLFFPLNALRSRKTQNSMRILTVGRNVNVSICAISQFPALVDKELIKHSTQIWIGLTSETNTLKYWRNILGDSTDTLKTLQNGQFIYYHRNKINLTEIELYTSTTPKTQIRIPEPKIVQIPEKPKQTKDSQALFSFLAMLIYAVVILSIMH